MINKIKINKNTPYITYGILIICTVLFLLMEIFGGSKNPFVLVRFGAKVNTLIDAGQYWRLITPMFLHIGLSHLLMNGLAIYYLGKKLELIFGHFKYLLIFIFSGIAGNALSYAINDTISAGASTAIFGLFTSVIALAKIFPRRPYIQMLSKQYRTLVIVNILFSLFSSGVDLAGHIGGAIGGYLATIIVVDAYSKDSKSMSRLLYLLIYIIFISLCLL